MQDVVAALPKGQAQKGVQVVLVVPDADVLQGRVVLQLVLPEHHLDLNLRQGLVDASQALHTCHTW